MVNVDIEKVVDIEKLRHTLDTLTINPLTIRPMAVHLKELNQVAPLSVESLRVDHVRHVDPLQIDQLNITSLPTVNLTMSQLPALDINVRRVPPVAVALHQQFEMCSDYCDDGAHSRAAADAPLALGPHHHHTEGLRPARAVQEP